MTATPDFAGDLKARIVALTPTEFPAVDIHIGKEQNVGGALEGGVVGERALFIKLVDDIPEDYDTSGSVRVPTFQLKHRADRTQDPNGTAALARMATLFDAMRTANPRAFTGGVSGRTYVEVWPRTGPRLLEEHYVVMDVTLALDDP